MRALSGQLAQLVEQRIENPRVRGSIPRLATRIQADPRFLRGSAFLHLRSRFYNTFRPSEAFSGMRDSTSAGAAIEESARCGSPAERMPLSADRYCFPFMQFEISGMFKSRPIVKSWPKRLFGNCWIDWLVEAFRKIPNKRTCGRERPFRLVMETAIDKPIAGY